MILPEEQEDPFRETGALRAARRAISPGRPKLAKLAGEAPRATRNIDQRGSQNNTMARTKQASRRVRGTGMRVVRPGANSPRVMDHAAMRRTDGQGRPYNHRWHSSREEMWALLMGRHERCGSKSPLRSCPVTESPGSASQGLLCAPVSHVELASSPSEVPDPYWNCAAVTLAPDPRRGVVARAASGSTVGVARLRVLSFTWSDRNSYEELRVTETLGLVAQHCRELRALRLEGPGGGESLGDDDGEGAAACRAAITSVLERCVDPTRAPGHRLL